MKNTNWYEEMDFVYAQEAALEEIYGANAKYEQPKRGKRKQKSANQLDRNNYFDEHAGFNMYEGW